MTADLDALIERLLRYSVRINGELLMDRAAAALVQLRNENARLLSDPMNVGWQHAQNAIKDRAAAVSQWKAAKQRAELAEQRLAGEIERADRAEARIANYQASRDWAIDTLAKALGIEADKVKAVEFYARLAAESIAALERDRDAMKP